MTAKTTGSGVRVVTLDVRLLDRDYKMGCKEGEEAELLEAVAFLDQRMRDIREGSKASSVERTAVMAALNIAHELLRDRSSRPAEHPLPASPGERSAIVPPAVIDAPAARRRIAGMRSAIDSMLAVQEKLL